MAKEIYDRINNPKSSQLKDIYLRHGINLTRYSNHQARKLLDILDQSNIQIKDIINRAKAVETKSKYLQIEREIKRITDELTEQLNETVKADFKDLAEEESLFVENAMRRVGVTADFELPAPARVWSAASFGTYGGEGSKDTYQSYLDGFGQNTFKVWDNAVRSGYLIGQTAQQINRAVLGSMQNLEVGQMQALRKSLETNTITMIAHLTSEARSETYRRNSSLFSGYRYIGVLDSRQCLACGVLDNKVFEKEEPQTPQHNRCRCLWIPEIKGLEGFDDDDERAGITYSKDKDGNIVGTGSPHPANTTYEQWLAKQPEDVRRGILGATRFELYKQGMPITSFVADGHKLTLDQLAEKEGIELPNHKRHGDTEGNADNININTSANANSAASNFINNDQVNNLAMYEELDTLRTLGKQTGNERLSIMNYDGERLGTWEGSKDAVTITKTIGRKLSNAPDNTLSVLHNHPKSSSFSLEDISVMSDFSSIREMRVIGHNGKVFTMDVGVGKRGISLKELEEYEKEIYTIARVNVGNSHMPNSIYYGNYYSERNRLIAEHFGWSYKEESPRGRRR